MHMRKRVIAFNYSEIKSVADNVYNVLCAQQHS